MKWSKTDKLFFVSLLPSSIVIIGLLSVTLLVVSSQSYKSISIYGFSLFTGNTWNAEREEYGLLTPIIGTFTTSTLATLISLFFSIPLSIFLTEFLRGRIRDVFTSLVELMAGIPTVVYAVWGLNYVSPFMRDHVLGPLHAYLGFIPFFSCRPLTGLSILTASVVLGISLVPFTTSIILESYKLIPLTYREACLGIGATRYELVKELLSISKPAVLAASILAFARASGETTIAATIVGNTFTTGLCIIGPGYTIPALIANQYANANLYEYAESVLYAAALIILIITLILSFTGLRTLEKWRVKIVV